MDRLTAHDDDIYLASMASRDKNSRVIFSTRQVVFSICSCNWPSFQCMELGSVFISLLHSSSRNSNGSSFVPVANRTSPPQSHLVRARRYPHIAECTLPLCVLAVACTMRNEALWSVAWRDGTLWNVTEALRIVTERHGSVTELLRNATEPLRKISILPITNWILNFAHH